MKGVPLQIFEIERMNVEVVPKLVDVFSIEDLLDLIPETRLRVGVD